MNDADLTLPIHTPRLVLREFRESDETAVHAYGGDPDVARFMPWGPNTPAESRDAVARALADQKAQPRMEYGAAITLAGEDVVVGSVGLHLREERRETAEIGYCLHRKLWGQGLIPEAAAAVMAAAFAELRLQRIWATCNARNAASWRVMEKLGMSREGLMRQDRWIKGEWRDTLLYAILAEDHQGMGS
ncbi:MAG TPA: GNAT family protein [Caulobacteraceae bacterium]|nr:GNAT family protein [Caulobacteraceae bacterium]